MEKKNNILWLIIGVLALIIVGLSIFTFNLYMKKNKTTNVKLDTQPLILDLVHTKSNRVVVRELPDSESETLDYIDSEQKAELISSSKEWSEIRYLGKTGYVETKDLEIINVDKYKINSNLPFRLSPNDGKVVAIIKKGSVIEGIEQIGKWRKVYYNNQIGYVSDIYLDEYKKYDVLDNL